MLVSPLQKPVQIPKPPKGGAKADISCLGRCVKSAAAQLSVHANMLFSDPKNKHKLCLQLLACVRTGERAHDHFGEDQARCAPPRKSLIAASVRKYSIFASVEFQIPSVVAIGGLVVKEVFPIYPLQKPGARIPKSPIPTTQDSSQSCRATRRQESGTLQVFRGV